MSLSLKTNYKNRFFKRLLKAFQGAQLRATNVL